MRLLAIDAVTEACSVALLEGAAVLGRFAEVGTGHAARVLVMVDEVLAEGGVRLQDLDAIAVDIGPGAFTGVRISVAVAQGLAFGADLPVVPIVSLEALALPVVQRGGAAALACLDARMGEVYWGSYAADAALGVVATAGPGVAPPAGVVPPHGGHAGVGRGFAAHAALALLPGVTLTDADRLALPDARQLALLAALRWRCGAGIDPAAVRPLYVRDQVALTEAERSRQRPSVT